MSEPTTILDQDTSAGPVDRRSLLPWWIKVFSWLFMIAGGVAPFGIVFAIIFNANFVIALYGLETLHPLSLLGLCLTSLYLLKGLVAYGLWFEKDWALNIGIVDAFIGIVICLIVMFGVMATTGEGHISFRLELIFLILFLAKLVKLKPQWK